MCHDVLDFQYEDDSGSDDDDGRRPCCSFVLYPEDDELRGVEENDGAGYTYFLLFRWVVGDSIGKCIESNYGYCTVAH
jgi:hypothetical protein